MKNLKMIPLIFLTISLASCGRFMGKAPVESSATESTMFETVDNVNKGTEADEFLRPMVDNLNSEFSTSEAPPIITQDDLAEKPIKVEEFNPILSENFIGAEPEMPKALEKTDVPPPVVPKVAKEEIKKEALVVEEARPIIKEENIIIADQNPTIKIYKVQKGETLMQIAFKLYGDISRWKELRKLNGDKLSRNSAVNTKTQLKYKAPEKEFIWNPEGTAYLIKNGETLGKISENVYQNPRNWKDLWKNNKPLIKNPNQIFAGFTLYYKSKDELASGPIEENISQGQSALKKIIN